MFPNRPVYDQRWITWENRSGQPVPAFGLLKINDVATIDDDAVLIYTGGGSGSDDDSGTPVYFSNGPQRVVAGRKGSCTADAPMQVLVSYTDAPPKMGDALGPNEDFPVALSPGGNSHTFMSFEGCPSFSIQQTGMTIRVGWVMGAAGKTTVNVVASPNSPLTQWDNETFVPGFETKSCSIVPGLVPGFDKPDAIDVAFIRQQGREVNPNTTWVVCAPVDLKANPPRYVAVEGYLKGESLVVEVVQMNADVSAWDNEEFEHGCETQSGDIVPACAATVPEDAPVADVRFIRREGREPGLKAGDRIQCVPLDLEADPPLYLAVGEYLKAETFGLEFVKPASGIPARSGLIPGVSSSSLTLYTMGDTELEATGETAVIYNWSNQSVEEDVWAIVNRQSDGKRFVVNADCDPDEPEE